MFLNFRYSSEYFQDQHLLAGVWTVRWHCLVCLSVSAGEVQVQTEGSACSHGAYTCYRSHYHLTFRRFP